MISLRVVVEKAVELKNAVTATKTRKRLLMGLAALAALQLYFVREMLAALLLFTMLFIVFAAVALFFFVVDFAGRRTLAWAEPQTKVAAGYARRAWSAAESSTMEVGRKVQQRWNAQRQHGG